MDYIKNIPGMDELLKDANHSDVQVAVGKVKLREYVNSFFKMPKWVDFFFHIRKYLALILGLKHDEYKLEGDFSDEVTMETGEIFMGFKVIQSEPDSVWLTEIEDKHLSANLGIFVEPLDDQYFKYHVLTIVHYKHWTGPVYFNIIKPFHYLVVRHMTRSAAK